MTQSTAPPGPRGLKLPIGELKLGMVVCDLDRPWLETPFALRGFPLRHPDDIVELARYCRYVYVSLPNGAFGIRLEHYLERGLRLD